MYTQEGGLNRCDHCVGNLIDGVINRKGNGHASWDYVAWYVAIKFELNWGDISLFDREEFAVDNSAQTTRLDRNLNLQRLWYLD